MENKILQDEKGNEYELMQFYGGEINIRFFEKLGRKRHAYMLGQKRIISVTSALGVIDKPFLLPWALKMMQGFLQGVLDEGAVIDATHIEYAKKAHKRKSEEAAAIGTEVHDWAEAYINNVNPELPEDENVLNGVTAFLQWVKEHQVEFLSSERPVYSKKHKYVGKMDAEAMVDGKKCVIDFKTSKKIYPEMALQVAAYQRAAEEEDGTKFDGNRWIARFDKETGEFEAVELENVAKDFQVFLSALKIKKWETSQK